MDKRDYGFMFLQVDEDITCRLGIYDNLRSAHCFYFFLDAAFVIDQSNICLLISWVRLGTTQLIYVV